MKVTRSISLGLSAYRAPDSIQVAQVMRLHDLRNESRQLKNTAH